MLFKLFDTVAVKPAITQAFIDKKGWHYPDFPKGGIPAGTQGTIVEVFEPKGYEVEFSNDHGETIALISLRDDELTLIQSASKE